ncbi:MAG: hypothetical protein Rsou_0381 [Candidatus Ruthia sp. Asou_11_S2]|nr:hypothetical protein [Candidatus Ruthia sp. Asou_11_S2]
MNFKISKKARKQLLKVDSRYQSNIFIAIESLPNGDVIKLAGCVDKYRLRVGFLRILFTMKNDNIEIYKIEKRGDVYK